VSTLKKLLKYSLLGLTLTAAASSAAFADPWKHHDPPKPEPRNAPEVDPSLAISGLSLLGGTLVVLRTQRRK
jgi:hypothetical protein